MLSGPHHFDEGVSIERLRICASSPQVSTDGILHIGRLCGGSQDSIRELLSRASVSVDFLFMPVDEAYSPGCASFTYFQKQLEYDSGRNFPREWRVQTHKRLGSDYLWVSTFDVTVSPTSF
jgi:hypothetical protein